MIKKEYTKQGIKLTHPSGVVSLTSRKDVVRFIEYQRKHLEAVQRNLKRAEDDLKAIDTS